MQQSANQQIDSTLARATLTLTHTLLDEHPMRICGTCQCLAAGHAIAQQLRQYCDTVLEEPFELHPGSLWNVGKVMALSYLLALALFVAGGGFMIAATIMCLFGLIYGSTHYVVCGNLFDRFFPAANGCNVVGILEPSAQVRQQIVIAGHHDAPYVLRFLQKRQELASIRLLLAIGFYVILTLMCILATIEYLSGNGNEAFHVAGLVLTFAGLLSVVPLFSLITQTPSPGAGDNLNASVMTIKVAEYFAAQRRAGKPLEHTRLVLLSTDGEEAGQRGAIAYVEQHANELSGIPSYVLNIDSVYRLRDLAVLRRDRNGTCPLSLRITRECCQIAQELGYPLQEIALPFGGGGTDAAAFAKQGIEATTFIGIPTALITRDLVYHTSEDTVEHIQPEAVQAVLDIAIHYVLRKDQQA